jgi:hypothetical protein
MEKDNKKDDKMDNKKDNYNIMEKGPLDRLSSFSTIIRASPLLL